MKNRLTSHVKRALYKLKRAYGARVCIFELVNITTNKQTGAKSSLLNKRYIDKAIVLPARDFRMFVYDLAYISANKDFTTGMFFDPTDLKIIIDSSDIPGWEVKVEQFLIINNKQYNITELSELSGGLGYVLSARVVRGSKTVRPEDTINVMNITQSAVANTDKLDFLLVSRLLLTQESTYDY